MTAFLSLKRMKGNIFVILTLDCDLWDVKRNFYFVELCKIINLLTARAYRR